MKYSQLINVILIFAMLCFVISCKQKTYDRYAYDPNRDTIPPDLTLTVPVNLDNYFYGEDIHVVGTLIDLESRTLTSKKSGKLKTLTLNVSVIDPIPDTVIKVLLSKSIMVDGKYGFTINEKTSLNSGAGISNCRLKAIATDYADRRDSAIVNFTVN